MSKSMSKVKIEYVDKELIIRIPLDTKKVYPASKTGKSNMVASSGGFSTEEMPAGFSISYNVIQKKEK